MNWFFSAKQSYPGSTAGYQRLGTRATLALLSLVIAAVFTLLLLSMSTGQAAAMDGAVDPSFGNVNGPNSMVFGLATQNDGKTLVSGYFTVYNNVARSRVARINTDGSLDTSFNVGSGPNGGVYSVVVQSDGKILIGGDFTSYNGLARNVITRLNTDGSLDTNFNVGSGPNGGIDNIAIQSDGKILIGGAFTSYNGTARNRIARLNTNGSLDTSFNVGGGPDARLHKLVIQNDNKIIIAGSFTSYNGVARNRIARLNADGSLDTSFSVGNGADADVNALVLHSNGKVLIGGDFIRYAETPVNRIARLNADGSFDASFDVGTGADFSVNSLAVQSDSKVLIGGDFTSYNGVGRNRIARLNADGSLDTSFNVGSGADYTVYTLAAQSNGKILIGGYFAVYNGSGVNRVARLNADGSFDAGFNAGSGANRVVQSVAVQNDGKILIGGKFTSYNGTVRSRVARLNTDGSLDTSFNSNPGADYLVYSVALQADGKILIGGEFTTYDETPVNGIARLNTDGSLDTSFNVGSGADTTIKSVAVQNDGKILIGGYFTSYNGVARNRIARLNADGSLDTSFNVGSGANVVVQSVAVQSDSKVIIGGEFTNYNGVARNRVARLNADGSLDASFNVGSGADYFVNTMVIQRDSKVIIGGQFTNYNGVARNRIARLNADGSLDNGFNMGSGVDSSVYSLAIQRDNKIIIAGNFSRYNGTGRNRIARLNPDGSLDASFNVDSFDAEVFSLALQGDNKLIVGGNFVTLGTYNRDYIVRLENTAKLVSDLSIISMPNPSSFGESVTFTATTSPITATGTITFVFGTGGNTTSVTTTLTSGLATYMTSTLPVGNIAVQASYSGDAIFAPSTSPVYTQTVNKTATSVQATSSPNPSPLGQAVTFSATVSPPQATGTVTFTIGAIQVSATLAGGVATYMTNTLASGNYLVSVAYGGSPTYSSSVGAGQYTHVVSPPAPGFIQWASSNYSVGEAGGSAVVTATRVGGTDGAVSATVLITNGTATTADYALPTNLTVSWDAGENGPKTFQLPIVNDSTYEGNETLTLGLTSPGGGATLGNPATATLTIVEDNDLPATSIVLASSANLEQFGREITLTATVRLVAPAIGAPSSGVVTFTEATTVLGTAQIDANGVAVLVLSNLSVGNHTLTAQYGGTTNYLGSPLSNQLVQVIKSGKIKPL